MGDDQPQTLLASRDLFFFQGPCEDRLNPRLSNRLPSEHDYPAHPTLPPDLLLGFPHTGPTRVDIVYDQQRVLLVACSKRCQGFLQWQPTARDSVDSAEGGDAGLDDVGERLPVGRAK